VPGILVDVRRTRVQRCRGVTRRPATMLALALPLAAAVLALAPPAARA